MKVIRIPKNVIPMRKVVRQFKNIKVNNYLKSVTTDKPRMSESFYQRSGVEL